MSMTIQVAPLAGGLVAERGPIFVMRGEGPTSYTLYNQNWAILVLSDFAHLGKKYIRLGLTESDSDGVTCKVWVWSFAEQRHNPCNERGGSTYSRYMACACCVAQFSDLS